MRLLFIGDIVSTPGREAVKRYLPSLKIENGIDVVVANAENVTYGRGITTANLKELQSYGVDYFTGGDHVFWQKGTTDIIDSEPIVIPANYSAMVPGNRSYVLDLGAKGSLLILNLLGRTFINEKLDDPFKAADRILEEYPDVKYKFLDFHAEATSEKYALAHYLDGRVDVVVGTHTHVPTCDQLVLPNGTMFISDAGMTGVVDSVLGVKKEIIIDLYRSGLNQRFEWAESGATAFRSVLFDLTTRSISRLDFLF